MPNQPIYHQIYYSIRNKIHAGHWPEGHKLPPSRHYAIELGVSRTSVVSAFEQLKAEGYVSSRPGSGYFVNAISAMDNTKPSVENQHKALEQEATTNRLRPPGSPDMRLFPHRQWAKCIAKVARTNPGSFVRSTHQFGNYRLRNAIARYLFDWRGISVNAEQILVTAGSIDALEICLRTLADDNACIGLENPGYPSLRSFVEHQGFKPHWLAVDSEGAVVPQVNSNGPAICVLTPSNQFPLGITLSANRRTEFLAWARKTRGWLVEDDYDSEFRYAGKPIPALTGFDQAHRSIYVGSFSKIFSSGLRLGFLVVPDGLTDRFTATLDQLPSKVSVAMQQALAEFIDSGEFYRHLRRVRRHYAERRKTLIDGINDQLAAWLSFADNQAGMLLSAKLPEGYQDSDIAQQLQQFGVSVEALSNHYSNDQKEQGLLIGFCQYEPQEINNNIEQIRRVLVQSSL